ncbi:MAG: arylamine N-acetyltransferase, partial [Candidimonas sp.]
VRPLGARVRLGAPDRKVLPRRTHMLLEVTIDSQRWITDVGVGAASLTGALRLDDGVEQATPHDKRRLMRDGGKWFHQVRRGEQWIDICEFTEDTMPLIDRVVANWYTSTNPDSNFRANPIAALALPGGRRVTLSGGDLKFWDAEGHVRERTLTNPAALLSALRQYFGIDLPAGTRLTPAAPLHFLCD